MNLEDNIIETYLRIEEIYRSITKDCKLRHGGFAPALSDAEVITMEIIGEQQGRRGDHAICFELGEQCGREAGFSSESSQCETFLSTQGTEFQSDAVGLKRPLSIRHSFGH